MVTPEPSPQLPSVIFAIPFPEPAQQTTKKLPAFALYTFPRSAYEKPAKDPLTGKAPKEKFVKKCERKWQHEVQEGQDIKKGVIKDAGLWKKFIGTVMSTAASVIRWMPSNVIEILGRLPPMKKLGKLSVYYPNPADIPEWFNLSGLDESKMDNSFFKLLRTTKSKSKKQTIASACLLPFTLAIEILFILPLCLFEINLAYFVSQVNGSRKAARFVAAQQKSNSNNDDEDQPAICEFSSCNPTEFSRTIEHVYSICSSIDPVKFPRAHNIPQPSYVASRDIATGLIEIFNQSVPPNVVARHVLDPDIVAEDLDRVLRKAVKEYFKTL